MTTTTSVELRITDREVVCDWGTFRDTPRTNWDWETDTMTVENISPLILVSKALADDPTYSGAPEFTALTHFYTEGGRRFMRICAANGTWVWELFNAHWDDGEECNVYVGQWRD